MLYYLSASLKDIPRVQQLRDALASRGHSFTFDWTLQGQLTDEDAIADAMIDEINGVERAEVFIMCLPGGRGSHVELGAALIKGKTIFLWDPTGEHLQGNLCGFYLYPTFNWLVGHSAQQVAEFVHCCPQVMGQRLMALTRNVPPKEEPPKPYVAKAWPGLYLHRGGGNFFGLFKDR